MAKLKYEIQWCGSGGPTPLGPLIRSKYLAGATGTPQTRVYLDGFTPPAFAAYPVTVSPADDAVYVVEYKDTAVALKQLGKFQLASYAAGCWVGGTYVNPFWTFDRFETYVQISGLISAGSGQTQVSLDLVNWKTMTSVGGAPELSVQYTNSELVTLGFTDTIPTIYYKRTFQTNVKAVGTVTSSSYPGQVGKAQLSIPSGVSPYIVGNTIQLNNMPGYGSSTTIAAVPGPNDIIINVPYYSGVSGASIGTLAAPCTGSMAADVFIGELSIAPFTASGTTTNETSADANDGSITLAIAGGSGIFAYDWGDGVTTQNRTGLQAGSYSVDITDTVTAQTMTLDFVITEPAPPAPVNGTIFDLPKMQSFRFVKETIPDDCSTFQDFDNTLLCKMKWYAYPQGARYYEKVCICDTRTVQIWSNFSGGTELTLRDMFTDALVKDYSNLVELKVQLQGIVQAFPVSVRPPGGTDGVGKSRVYFNAGAIPLPLELGDTFNLINNPDGLNGAYEILEIKTDTITQQQYLLITLTWALVTPSSPGTAQFIDSVLDFDIYEAPVSFNTIAPGYYYLRARGLNTDGSFTTRPSEPIDVRAKHPKTNLLEWRCNDNAFGMAFTTGIVNRNRIESHLVDPDTGGEDENYRESNGSPLKLVGRPQRKYAMRFYKVPFYMVEKLRVIWSCDQVLVNKVEYVSEEGTGSPQKKFQKPMYNVDAIIEQRTWFEDYNGDDQGSVETGFVTTQMGFVKRT